MRRVAVLLSIVLGPFAVAGSPRISFDRLLPAAHDLGAARDLALIEAPKDADTFADNFLDQVNHNGLHVRDLRNGTGPADAYLAVHSLQCESVLREGEGSVRDSDGNRVKRKQVWSDAVCSARIDVMSRDMKKLSMFFGRGEGTSPRVNEVTNDERAIAIAQAARYAAIDAAERITPRRVREHIPLDETAPAFSDAIAFIESGHFADARAVWETELRRNPRSAPLHYNLAAVCEALGDRAAAKSHYVAANQLAPKEERYASEMRLFARRQ